MWNTIEKDVLDKYIVEPVWSDNFQDFWKNILYDYSSDYWSLFIDNKWMFDTVGYFLHGKVISKFEDCDEIEKVELTVDLNGGEYIKIAYNWDNGRISIPIGWFENREEHINKWRKAAKNEYVNKLKEAIRVNEHILNGYIEELAKFENNGTE